MLKKIMQKSALMAFVWSLSMAAYAIADGVKQVNVPPGDLVQALRSLQKQVDIDIVYQAAQLSGIKTRGVSGMLTPQEAVTKLLQGTKLRIRLDAASGAMLIEALPAKSSSTWDGGAAGSSEFALPATDGSPENGGQNGSSTRIAQSNSATSSNPAAPSQVSSSVLPGAETSGLSEIVVTAQKREERLKDVPISISVLSGQQLDQSSFSGVTDALNTIPGVSATVGVQGGGTQIVVRGVGASEPLFNGSSPVGYYLDSAPFGLVKSAILPDSNIYDLERVEVLRGPQGTLYGASAENGLVRVLTHDADLNQFELKARTTGSITDDGGGNYGGDMAINVPLIEGVLAVRGVVDYQNSSGWINSPIGNHINDSELRTYRLKIDAQPTDQLSIGLSAWRTRDNYGAPSTSTDDRRTFALLPEPIDIGYDVYGLKIGYNSSRFSVTSSTSYLDYTNDGTLDLDIYNIPLKVPVATNIASHVFSQEVVVSSAPADPWRWTAGVFYRNAADTLFQNIPGVYVVPTDFTSGSRSYAEFGQFGRRFFNDQWEWSLGVRDFHDDVSSQENIQGQGLANVPLIHQTASFSHPTPRAVLTWYPNGDVTAYGSYSEGFRSGALQDPSALHVDPALAPLKPDKLHNYEMGAKADLFDRRLTVDTAVYYIVWDDVQQSVVLPRASGVGVTDLVNGQSASGPGFDLALTTQPVDGLKVGLTFSWNDVKLNSDVMSDGVLLFAKGDRLNYSSEFTGGGLADYTFPIDGTYKGRFSVSSNYSSKQTDHAIDSGVGIVNTGDHLFNARTAFSVISADRWTATLFVDNFTNNYGASPQSLFPVPDLSPRPRPRTIGLQVDFHL